MRGRRRVLRAGLFRGDPLFRIVITAVISLTLILSAAADLATRRAAREARDAALLRYGAVSILFPQGDYPDDVTIRAIRAQADAIGMQLGERRRGTGIADGRFVEWLAVDNPDAGSELEPPGSELWVAVVEEASIQWTTVPEEYVLGCAGPCDDSSTVFINGAWDLPGGTGTAELADLSAADPFTAAFDLTEVTGVEALAWPERIGLQIMSATGAIPAGLRPLVIALGMVAAAGTLVVAVRGRAASIRLTRAMGIPGGAIRRVVGNEALLAGALAVGIAGLVALVASLGRIATVEEILELRIGWYVGTALLLPAAVARLVAWRVVERSRAVD